MEGDCDLGFVLNKFLGMFGLWQDGFGQQAVRKVGQRTASKSVGGGIWLGREVNWEMPWSSYKPSLPYKAPVKAERLRSPLDLTPRLHIANYGIVSPGPGTIAKVRSREA